jgi:hypothetical protein
MDRQFDAFIELRRAFAAQLGGVGSAVLVMAQGCKTPESELLTALTDAAGEFSAMYRPIGGAAWIVRPDGHIAWRSRGCSIVDMESWAMRAACTSAG